MEKPRQLMMVPGVLVTVSAPVCCEKAALPTTTCGLVGNAKAAGAAKHAATATLNKHGIRTGVARLFFERVFMAHSSMRATVFAYYSSAWRHNVSQAASVNKSHFFARPEDPPPEPPNQNENPIRACSFHAPR